MSFSRCVHRQQRQQKFDVTIQILEPLINVHFLLIVHNFALMKLNFDVVNALTTQKTFFSFLIESIEKEK